MKRKAVIAVTVVVALIAGFFGYGWWTRRGPIEFTEGGAFGAAPSPSSTPSAVASPGDGSRGSPSSSATPMPTAAASKRSREPGAVRARRAGSLVPPAPGSYVFEGSGRESVRFGPASACGWDIERVTMAAKREGDSTVLDWVWSANRQQRGIYQIGERGMLHRFYGAVATCVGVRRTEEGSYSPPVVRLAGSLAPGVRWTSTASSDAWSERMTGEVLRRERVRVPAGTFDAYVIRMHVDFSEGQTGTFDATMWYAPAVGVWVKEDTHTDIEASGADFTSDYTIELASYPR